MANTGSFSHYSNYGPFGRARRFGFGGNVRENIALGHRNVLQAFVGWRNSGGHWASIVSDAPEVGFGYAVSKGGTPYWVAVYGYPTDKDNEAETKLLEHRTDVAAGSPADSSTSAKADSDSSASKSASSKSKIRQMVHVVLAQNDSCREESAKPVLFTGMSSSMPSARFT
jgi:hypothetical protein